MGSAGVDSEPDRKRPSDAAASEVVALRDLLASVLFDNADGVLIIDAAGDVLEANPAAERMLGRPEGLAGYTFGFPMTAEGSVEVDVVVDGTVHTLEIRSAGTRLGGNDVHVVTTRDVSERKRAEQALRDFVSMTSHEFRTPLTTISGFAQTILERWKQMPDDRKREYLDVIMRQAQRLSRLTVELLTISKLDADAVTPDTTDVGVLDTLERVLTILGDGDHHVDVEVEVELGLVVRVDADHLQDILINFLTNAAKYGEPPFRVEARSLPGKRARIDVIDHGAGVPPEFVDKLFERYTRARSGKGRDAPGTGLGLNVVAGLARRNGGDVTYETNEPHGSRFVLTLPRASA